MEEERFQYLLAEARKFAGVKSDILNIGVPNARAQLRRTLDILEAECSQEQWLKVLAALEEGWP